MAKILWVDTETTGLDPETLSLLEVALVVTGDALEVIDYAMWYVPCDTIEAYHKADDYVKQMHTKNGLWREHHAAQPVADPSDAILTWCAKHSLYPQCGAMFGQGVAYDREVLRIHLPRVRSLWNHRTFDVSGFADLLSAPRPADETKHRAIDDALASVVRCRHLLFQCKNAST